MEWGVFSRRKTKPEFGFTLLELIVATTILSILTLMALPLARLTIQREKEKRLRHALWEMRDAIDRYKAAGDGGMFQIKADSFGYGWRARAYSFPLPTRLLSAFRRRTPRPMHVRGRTTPLKLPADR